MDSLGKRSNTINFKENVEQTEPFFPLSDKTPRQSTYSVNSSGSKCMSVSPSLATSQLSKAASEEHPSPTHTAELMRLGDLPKNRRRPGSTSDTQQLTVTGTITRGYSVGQPVEVQLELTETEYLRLASREALSKGNTTFFCGRLYGPHVILWSLICIPIAWTMSLWISFYNGSIAWYNLFIYFSEEKTIIHRIILCPLIVLSFPITVGLSSFILSLAASVLQISWSWPRWLIEIKDGEKGFYGWFCGVIRLPNCSPYQVVLLDGANI